MKLLKMYILLVALLHPNANQDYFSIVNEAEELIIKKSYSEAMDIYAYLFDNDDKHRSYDYYNALLCAIQVNDEDKAFEYLYQLPQKGYNLEFLQNNLIVSYFKNKPAWNQFLIDFNSLHQFYLETTQNPLVRELEQMFDKDQAYSYDLMMGKIDQLVVDSLYYKNIKRVIEICKNDTLPKVEHFDFYSENKRSIVPFVLFRHYFGMVNRARFYSEDYKGTFYEILLSESSMIEEEINKMVKNGLVSPEIISESLEYYNPNDIFGKLGKNHGRCKTNEKGQEIMVEYVISRKNYSEKEIQQFDSLRAYWFLPDFKLAMQKEIYFNQFSDSIQDQFKYNFRLNGRLCAKEFYIGECGEDSLKFHQQCEKNLIGKFGYALEWVYCGEKGKVLPNLE